MKRSLLFTFIGLIFGFGLRAQPVVTNASFPDAGDKLYFAVDTFPNIPLGDPSPNFQTWDFSNTLEIDAWDVQDIGDATIGEVADSFPTADIITPFFSGDGYSDVGNDSIEVVGFFGSPTPELADFDLFIRMDPPLTAQRAGITYGDILFDTGGFDVKIASEDIPPDADLPFDPTSADSVRVIFTIMKEDTVDAWGSLTTPFSTYDVIRVKETEYRNTQVLAKLDFFGWIDLGTFPIDGIGPDTLVYYNWLSATSKEPICRTLTGINEFGVFFQLGWFKVDENYIMTVSTEDPVADPRELTAFPNPATTSLNIRVNGFPNGDYSLNVYNVLGKLVESRPIQLNGLLEEQIDLFRYPQGTYLYSIFDENGTNLLTKRFFVHRP